MRTVLRFLVPLVAAVTLGLGPGHVDPRDIEYAIRVDAFDFAMEARRSPAGLELVSL